MLLSAKTPPTTTTTTIITTTTKMQTDDPSLSLLLSSLSLSLLTPCLRHHPLDYYLSNYSSSSDGGSLGCLFVCLFVISVIVLSHSAPPFLLLHTATSLSNDCKIPLGVLLFLLLSLSLTCSFTHSSIFFFFSQMRQKNSYLPFLLSLPPPLSLSLLPSTDQNLLLNFLLLSLLLPFDWKEESRLEREEKRR